MLITSAITDPSFLLKHNVQDLYRLSDVQKRAIILICIIDTTTLGDIVLPRDHDPASAGILDGRRPPGIGWTGTGTDGHPCGLETTSNMKGVVRLVIESGAITTGSCITALAVQ